MLGPSAWQHYGNLRTGPQHLQQWRQLSAGVRRRVPVGPDCVARAEESLNEHLDSFWRPINERLGCSHDRSLHLWARSTRACAAAVSLASYLTASSLICIPRMVKFMEPVRTHER